MIKQILQQLKQEIQVLRLAIKHPATPWYARWWTLLVIGLALSPIDLIPDFIPVIGYLDDLLFIPAGIWVARRLIPKEVMAECRQQVSLCHNPPPSL